MRSVPSERSREGEHAHARTHILTQHTHRPTKHLLTTGLVHRVHIARPPLHPRTPHNHKLVTPAVCPLCYAHPGCRQCRNGHCRSARSMCTQCPALDPTENCSAKCSARSGLAQALQCPVPGQCRPAASTAVPSAGQTSDLQYPVHASAGVAI